MGGWLRVVGAGALCAAVLAACTTTAPGDDDTPPTDSGPGVPDATPECRPPPGSTSGKLIRVVYMVPSDREPNPLYVATLEAAVLSLQLWLRDRMPNRTSFRVHEPVVNVVRTEHPESFYRSNVVDGVDPYFRFWDNVRDDTFLHLDTDWNDPDNVWLVYADADAACDQLGTGGVAHLAVLPKNDLRGLAGEERVPPCGGTPDNEARCRWVGGMGLLMFIGMGVPNPAEEDCDQACKESLLSWWGYQSFPEATVDAAQQEFLAGTGFVSAVGLPDCEIDCNQVPELE
jgi:hypothetical protein